MAISEDFGEDEPLGIGAEDVWMGHPEGDGDVHGNRSLQELVRGEVQLGVELRRVRTMELVPYVVKVSCSVKGGRGVVKMGRQRGKRLADTGKGEAVEDVVCGHLSLGVPDSECGLGEGYEATIPCGVSGVGIRRAMVDVDIGRGDIAELALRPRVNL